MRRSILMLAVLAMPALAQQGANAGASAARANWKEGHDYLVRAAEQVPESLYAFKPVAGVRSMGQLFAHVAGSERMYCAMVLGTRPTAEDDIERTKTAKADIVRALKDAATYCERAYAVTDVAAMINVFGQQQSKLYALTQNATHDWEHYGNIVTYMRIKGMVPPSSQ